jgi:hypothetical protein
MFHKGCLLWDMSLLLLIGKIKTVLCGLPSGSETFTRWNQMWPCTCELYRSSWPGRDLAAACCVPHFVPKLLYEACSGVREFPFVELTDPTFRFVEITILVCFNTPPDDTLGFLTSIWVADCRRIFHCCAWALRADLHGDIMGYPCDTCRLLHLPLVKVPAQFVNETPCIISIRNDLLRCVSFSDPTKSPRPDLDGCETF